MYNVVTRYVTGDGVEHKTEAKAREHVATTIKTRIKDMLHNVVATVADGSLTVTDIYAITEEIYHQRGKLHQVFNLDFYGDDYDSE